MMEDEGKTLRRYEFQEGNVEREKLMEAVSQKKKNAWIGLL